MNWIKKNDKEYQINDYKLLKDNKQHIDIIAPGSMKYKAGMINGIFRSHREIFNKLITDSKKNFSIFIYGYGFNDQSGVNLGTRNTFADCGRTISDYLGVPDTLIGTSFLHEILTDRR